MLEWKYNWGIFVNDFTLLQDIIMICDRERNFVLT